MQGQRGCSAAELRSKRPVGHGHGGEAASSRWGADGARCLCSRLARGCGQGGGAVLAREPASYRGSTRLPMLVMDSWEVGSLGHADADQRRWEREDTRECVIKKHYYVGHVKFWSKHIYN